MIEEELREEVRKLRARNAELERAVADIPGIRHCHNSKYDFQLINGVIEERNLARIFAEGVLEKIELKSEQFLWEQTGHIAIEFMRYGRPSGIAVTEATCWVHELLRDRAPLCWIMFPTDRLKELCRVALKAGRVKHRAGDGGHSSLVLLKLRDILQ